MPGIIFCLVHIGDAKALARWSAKDPQDMEVGFIELVDGSEIQFPDVLLEHLCIGVISTEGLNTILIDIERDIRDKSCFPEALVQAAGSAEQAQKNASLILSPVALFSRWRWQLTLPWPFLEADTRSFAAPFA